MKTSAKSCLKIGEKAPFSPQQRWFASLSLSSTMNMDADQLSHTLTQLLDPDTARVKQAETMLKPYMKNPLCLGGLLQQVRENNNTTTTN